MPKSNENEGSAQERRNASEENEDANVQMREQRHEGHKTQDATERIEECSSRMSRRETMGTEERRGEPTIMSTQAKACERQGRKQIHWQERRQDAFEGESHA